MKLAHTDIFYIAFEQAGPPDGFPILLLHGWPDAPRGWNEFSKRLTAEGVRTIAPFLRVCRPSEIVSKETTRVGAGVALAQDAVDLADALNLKSFAVVGHDWGARVAYTLAALFPERGIAIAALAFAFHLGGEF